MLGFQPYETFQLLIETGGIDRTNTLLIAACDAYARRGRATQQETEQFYALAARLFPAAAPSARAKAAAALGRSESLSPELEELIVTNIGDDLAEFLMSAPKLLMVDELSLGLSPLLVEQLVAALRTLNAEGMSILLVEQDVITALDLCHSAFVMDMGRIVRSGSGQDLLADPIIGEAYLGVLK